MLMRETPAWKCTTAFQKIGSAVAKVANTGHHHGQVQAVRDLDYLVIAHGAAGLDDGGGTCVGDDLKAIREGEKGVRGCD